MLSTPCICGPFAGASSKSPNVVLIARSWLNDDPIPPRAGEGIALNFGVSFVPSYSVGVSTRCVDSVKISAYFRACDILQHARFFSKHFPQNSTSQVTQHGVYSPTNSLEGMYGHNCTWNMLALPPPIPRSLSPMLLVLLTWLTCVPSEKCRLIAGDSNWSMDAV